MFSTIFYISLWLADFFDMALWVFFAHMASGLLGMILDSSCLGPPFFWLWGCHAEVSPKGLRKEKSCFLCCF